MARNPRYDVLFEPVRIGPVTARNRFYAVPHAAGMTNAMPHMRAAFRGTKAQGGWGVVCSGYVSIDPGSDDAPLPYATLWDEEDVRAHALMTDAVHAHGALAGVELWHGGGSVMNRSTRLPPLSPSGTGWMATHVNFMGNQRPKVMDAADIRALVASQAAAARRAVSAGFDIVYVYAGMGYLPYEFLLPEWNRRTDAYGGSVRNRVRIVRELLEATHAAVAGRCAVALCRRGQPRGDHRFRQETHRPSGGRGRALHFARHHGEPDQARGARPDRCRPPLDRRPVPAAQDRRRARAGHPRVHRLQHLHLQLARRRAGALHAEPDDRRGVAARLAPRAHRAGGQQCCSAGGGRRPRRS